MRFAQRFTICENLLKSVQTKFGRLCIRVKCDTLHLYIGKESDRPPFGELESDRRNMMIWNKKKDGAENPGAETPAAQTTKAPVLFLQKNWK